MLAIKKSGDFELDVVGIGALNLDYVAHSSLVVDSTVPAESLIIIVSKLLTELDPPVEWNTERTVSEQEMELALSMMPATTAAALGGSAFNTIHALGAMQLGLRLGYVGIAGRTPSDAPSFFRKFDELGVDHSFVHRIDSRYCGICLSIMECGEPTMLTHAGANIEMAHFLAVKFDEIVTYLAKARVVHVTSFLDSLTPQQLLRTLRAVRKRNPKTIISVDPGYGWCTEFTPAIKGILRLSDFLSVNELELRELSNSRLSPVNDDEHAAHSVLRHLMSPKGVLLAKNPSGVRCYRFIRGEINIDRYSHVPLRDNEIVDATGAGDVFIGGLLAGVWAHQHRLAPGALLGIRLAKLHLQYLGDRSLERFASITREFIDSARIQ